jgi:hypothetical protein
MSILFSYDGSVTQSLAFLEVLGRVLKMAQPGNAEPVKLFAAVLYARDEALRAAVPLMESAWGEIDYTGPDRSFDLTDYYEPEMGKNLRRRLISFRELFSPECLGEAKHIANDIEDKSAGKNGRLVNLDVGYLDLNKIVLASFKGAGQKIYLGGGAWADMIARYRGGRYQPFEWTFPDFRDGRYDAELKAIREILRGQPARIFHRGS